jgi:hypothetical protein
MTDRAGFTARELTGLLPGGWTLADVTDPGQWDEAEQRWSTRLVDGADVLREVVVEAAAMDRHGPAEAFRIELDRVYRRVVRRGLFG